jgi:hypothetical protein
MALVDELSMGSGVVPLSFDVDRAVPILRKLQSNLTEIAADLVRLAPGFEILAEDAAALIGQFAYVDQLVLDRWGTSQAGRRERRRVPGSSRQRALAGGRCQGGPGGVPAAQLHVGDDLVRRGVEQIRIEMRQRPSALPRMAPATCLQGVAEAEHPPPAKGGGRRVHGRVVVVRQGEAPLDVPDDAVYGQAPLAKAFPGPDLAELTPDGAATSDRDHQLPPTGKPLEVVLLALVEAIVS